MKSDVSSYNPYLVKNPRSDCHDVRLFLGQELHISFLPPSKLGHPEGSYWSNTIRGNFIKGLEINDSEFRTTFKFLQKNVSSEWISISNTLLGNIDFNVVYPDNTMHLWSRVSVYLMTNNHRKSHCLTVVQPDMATCKLYPNELLEVVLPSEGLDWKCYIYPIVTDGRFGMMKVREEFLGAKEVDNRRNQDNHYYCGHRIFSGVATEGFWRDEEHFWFTFDEQSKEFAVQEKTSGSYPASRIVFVGKDKQGKFVKEYYLRTNIRVKKGNSTESNVNIVTKKDDLHGYRYNLPNRTLYNPKEFQTIDLHSEKDEFWVEVAQQPGYSKGAWNAVLINATGEYVNTNEIFPLKVTIVKTHSYTIDGVELQRFCVRPKDLDQKAISGTLLGIMDLTLKGDTKYSRRILFRYSPPRLYVEQSYSKNRSLIATEPSKKDWSCNNQSNYKYQRVDYADVEFVPFCTQSAEPLELGEKVLNFGKSHITYTKSGGHNPYYDDFQANDGEYYYGQKVPSKKKGSDNNNSCSWSPNQSPNRNGSESSERNKRNATNEGMDATVATVGARGDNRTGVTVCRNSVQRFEIFDPQNMSTIEIHAGESMIVQMPIADEKQDWSATEIKSLEDTTGAKIALQKKSAVKAKSANPLTYFREFVVTPQVHGSISSRRNIGSVKFVLQKDGERKDERLVFVDILPARESNLEKVKSPKISMNLLSKRFTVVDPQGSCKVEIRPGEQLEIILHNPLYFPRITATSGKIEIIDNSSWTFWDGSRVQRILCSFNFEKEIFGKICLTRGIDQPIWGEINVQARDTILRSIESQSETLITERPGSRIVLLQRWQNNQLVEVLPNEELNVEIESPEQYIKLPVDVDRVNVHFKQIPLTKEVLNRISEDISPCVDPNRPWHKDDILVHPGSLPWSKITCMFQPFAKGLWTDHIIKAMRDIWGNQPSFPVGDLIVTYPVGKKYDISQVLRVNIADPSFYSDFVRKTPSEGFSVYDSPAGDITVRRGRGCVIRLTTTWDTVGQTRIYRPWRIRSVPSWLKFVQLVQEGSTQLFFFFCRKDVEPQNSGFINFMTGSKTHKIRVISY